MKSQAEDPSESLLDVFERMSFKAVQEDGTITLKEKNVPLPMTLSEEAKIWMRGKFKEISNVSSINPTLKNPAEFRSAFQDINNIIDRQWLEKYPVTIHRDQIIGGIRTDIMTPVDTQAMNTDRIMINLMAGGGTFGDNASHEGIVVANVMNCKVLIPRFRLPPEHSLLEGIADVCVLYKEILKDYGAANIGIYGTCSGGLMAAQVTTRLFYDGIDIPGAIASLGAVGGATGDSNILNRGLYPDVLLFKQMSYIREQKKNVRNIVDPKDPVISPQLARLDNFPPTLLMAGGREVNCSSTTLLHRALRRAGVDAELYIFDGMFHSFHRIVDFPESSELFFIVTDFFNRKLGSDTRRQAKSRSRS